MLEKTGVLLFLILVGIFFISLFFGYKIGESHTFLIFKEKMCFSQEEIEEMCVERCQELGEDFMFTHFNETSKMCECMWVRERISISIR